jgi:hypothetical protein
MKVLTSKPDYCTKEKRIGALMNSQVAPKELTLSEGQVGSLVDEMYVHKSEEAENSISDAFEWKQIYLQSLESTT